MKTPWSEEIPADVARTVRVLARQVLALRKKAKSARLPGKRRFFAREQKELYERLKGILAASKESDPLLDDITLEEIGITGDTPGQDEDDEAGEQLTLRLENAEAGGRPTVGNIKIKTPSGRTIQAGRPKKSIQISIQEDSMFRPTEDQALDNEPEEKLIPTPAAPEPPALLAEIPARPGRRQYTRKKTTEPTNGTEKQARPEPLAVSPVGDSVTLDMVQLSKLWQATTGGRITVDESGEELIFHVSLDSFRQALPALLRRL